MAVEANSVGAGGAQDTRPSGKKREGPVAWFFFGLLLWIVALPMWMYRRSSYGLRNLCGASLLVAAIYIGSIFALGATGGLKMSTTDLAEQVKQNITQTWAQEPALAGARINSFSLIHKEGNHYEGLLEATADGETEKLAIDVTYDGKQFMWKVRQ
jgi:hypothetical protein